MDADIVSILCRMLSCSSTPPTHDTEACPVVCLIVTVQALMDADIVSILCRMLSCSTTDGTQKLQCLHMLRVLVHDPSTHEAMVQAKAVHVIVQQVCVFVRMKALLPALNCPNRNALTLYRLHSNKLPTQVSSVVVSKGLVQEDKKSSVSTPLASPQKGHPKQQQQFQRQLNDGEEGGDWDMDLEQQRVELAVLMLMDMAPGPHKVGVYVCVHMSWQEGMHLYKLVVHARPRIQSSLSTRVRMSGCVKAIACIFTAFVSAHVHAHIQNSQCHSG
eukprot:1156812-Pelagomonas_calceolata.AAC.6